MSVAVAYIREATNLSDQRNKYITFSNAEVMHSGRSHGDNVNTHNTSSGDTLLKLNVLDKYTQFP